MEQTLDISWKSIVKFLITGFALYVLFLVKGVVIWIFFALVISVLLEPAIDFLRKMRVPRVAASILIYLSIFSAMGLLIYLSAPIFIFEIQQIIQGVPEYFEKIHPIFRELGIDVARNFEDFMAAAVAALQESSTGIVKAISVFFGGIASTIVIFVFAFFISLEGRGAEKAIVLLVPQKYEGTVLDIFEKSRYKVAGWFGARILACVFVGVASLLVFLLLGIKYSFILALISGALTFVPFVGPMITAIIAFVVVGASSSWLMAAYVIVVLTIIQSIEGNIVNPLLMKKFINLPPVLVLASLLAGGIIFGVLGMIFIVPVFGIAYEFLREFLEERKTKQLY